ncbi:hypothetical protein SAM40697_6012 [Streptomyces ambofaciens]|uniref:Lipopolysaccharide assembly protein A domain-containing protein n=1 Tax=Streptomyces ambofaciens TaxID=1889 RepID=A0ABM6B9M4_STRAM|nr:hypothetical protein [Streptomyces ambofaciens]ANB09965.1 hypothetical protein SAM40697_6012 [Streptomyces ambofaciens]
MLVLGLLLMAGAAAFAGLLIAYNLSGGPDYTVTLLGSQPFTVSTLGAFLGGIALTLIFGLGMWMLLAGTVLARRRGKKHRRERETALRATAERDELAGRMDGEGGAGTAPGAPDRRGPTLHRPNWLRPHSH